MGEVGSFRPGIPTSLEKCMTPSRRFFVGMCVPLIGGTSVSGEAWRRLVIVLAQVKGDRKVEALLKEKHPELLTIAAPRLRLTCGALVPGSNE